MTDSYLTIEKASEGMFKDKGSKFLAFAYPVESEDKIREYIQKLRKEHHAARHHCFAWRLGAAMEHFRSNDDGEPSSSAGKPILGQIQRLGLTDVLIVVVRYFGGTLLGVGGLIKAYGEAAADALSHATIITRIVKIPFCIHFDYLQMNAVMKIFKEKDLPQIKSDFNLRCSICSSARQSEVGLILSLFSQIEGVVTERME
ncbi:MAG: YigZ family protein [Prolixibacteraceae bacterium]